MGTAATAATAATAVATATTATSATTTAAVTGRARHAETTATKRPSRVVLGTRRCDGDVRIDECVAEAGNEAARGRDLPRASTASCWGGQQ